MASTEWNNDIPAVGNQIATDIGYIEKNFEEIKEILDDITDGTVGTTDTASFNVIGLGTRNIWIPSNLLWTRDTNGGAVGRHEYAVVSNFNMYYYAFDGATEEYVDTYRSFPEAWDRGTVKAKFYWAPGSSACSAGDTVEWEIAMGALSDDDTIDAALGTSQVISDTVLAGKSADLHITSATPAITVGGTPALGDLIKIEVSRNVGGTDDMTEDAWLFGVMLQITLDQSVTAW